MLHLGRLGIGFWPRQQWLRAEKFDCACHVWCLLLGPFSLELLSAEMYECNRPWPFRKRPAS